MPGLSYASYLSLYYIAPAWMPALSPLSFQKQPTLQSCLFHKDPQALQPKVAFHLKSLHLVSVMLVTRQPL